MQIEIRLDDGSNITIDNADRVYERDDRNLYIYDQRNAVLAIVQKDQVLRLTQRPGDSKAAG